MHLRILASLFLIAVITTIQACGGVLVAGAAVTALVAHDMRPTKVVMDDEWIEVTATDKLYSDPQLTKRIHVNVTSFNYTVLLTGETLSKELRDRALDIVRNLDDVKRVYNEIRITDLASFQSRTDDTWLTSKVKSKMYGATEFDASSRVKVVTENRTVYLMGFVTMEQGSQAAELASNVEGVNRVVKLFEYVEPEQENVHTAQKTALHN